MYINLYKYKYYSVYFTLFIIEKDKTYKYFRNKTIKRDFKNKKHYIYYNNNINNKKRNNLYMLYKYKKGPQKIRNKSKNKIMKTII